LQLFFSMADEAGVISAPEPKQVEYHPVTGVPEEFHDYLHKDSDEYKRLKVFIESGAAETADKVAGVSLEVRADRSRRISA
jgi:hypothetical protein